MQQRTVDQSGGSKSKPPTGAFFGRNRCADDDVPVHHTLQVVVDVVKLVSQERLQLRTLEHDVESWLRKLFLRRVLLRGV